MQHKNKIQISNLYPDVEAEDLMEMFEEFGQVLSIDISEDLDPVLETCFAVVTMDYEGDAEEALESIHGKRWKGLRLELDYYDDSNASKSRYEDENDRFEEWSDNSKKEKKLMAKRPRGFRNS